MSARLLQLFILNVLICVATPTDNVTGNGTYDNHTTHAPEDHKKSHGVHIVELKYEELRELLIFTIVVLLAGLSKVGFHYIDKLSSRVPESCLLIAIGVLFGGIFRLTGVSETLPEFFTPDAFFHFLLPPIILEAAFSLYDRTFLQNIGSILIFSVIGTLCAASTIGLCLIGLHKAGAMEAIDVTPIQLLVFSSLIVAVDPVAVLAVFNEVGVNRVLYFLVFGESLLNDGVTVVLYNVFIAYNTISTQGGKITAEHIVLGFVKFFVVCFGGLAIGVIIGILSSILTKYTRSVKVVEPIAIFGMAYLAFILAEMFHFSGIISLICCGLIQVAYAFNNLNRKSCTAIKYFTRVMSTTTEIIIFMFLGLLLVRDDHQWKTGFILWTLVLCFIARFFYTYLFSFIINRFDKSRVRKIGLDEMFIMSYGGLRGAVCFSLVALLKYDEFPTKNLFITTTLTVIIFSVFIQGSTIKPLVTKLRVKLATTSEPNMYGELNGKMTDHMMAGMEEIVGNEGNFFLMEKMKRFQDTYFRKILLRDPEGFDQVELVQTYERLVMKEHYKNLQLCGVKCMSEKSDDMRKIDSSAMLLRLANNTDELDPEEEEKETTIRKKSVRDRSNSTKTPSVSDFRQMMEQHASTTRMIPQGMFDRNMARHSQFSMMQQLQNKRKSNLKLQRMTSIKAMPERALSWSEDDTDICIRRGGEGRKGVLPAMRRQTFDVSPTDSHAMNVRSCDSQIMDTVFEEDETEANKPLLQKASSVPLPTGSPAAPKKSSSSSASPNVSATCTVISSGHDGDTIVVGKVDAEQPFGKAGDQVLDGNEPDNSGPPERKCSSGHILTRQGAMDDIPLKPISRSTSQ